MNNGPICLTTERVKLSVLSSRNLHSPLSDHEIGVDSTTILRHRDARPHESTMAGELMKDHRNGKSTGRREHATFYAFVRIASEIPQIRWIHNKKKTAETRRSHSAIALSPSPSSFLLSLCHFSQSFREELFDNVGQSEARKRFELAFPLQFVEHLDFAFP